MSRPALTLLMLLLPVTPAFCLPADTSVKTVWDRIMEEQGSFNLRKGYAYMAEENYPAAADEFFKASQRTPASPWPHISYGSALYWLGEPDKALDEFETALKLDPANSMAYQLRGIARARQGLYKEAFADFLEAVRLAPERADVRMNAGSVAHVLGDYPAALENFRKAVQLDGANPLYRYQLGLFYSRLGRYDQASAELAKAISLFPEYEDAMLELAVLKDRDGDQAGAVKLYRKALSVKPGDSVARFRLALALARSGRAAEIPKALDGAFLIAPANDKGGISMAVAYASPPAGEAGAAGPAADAQGSPLYSALSRLPAEQDARVEVEFLEVPRSSAMQKASSEAGAAGGKLAAALGRPRVNYTKREYFLPASAPQERLKKAAEVAAEADKLLKNVAPGSDSKMSFNIETSRPSPSGAEKDTKARVLYKPRDVGNDMGLWIMGDNWLENVGEAVDEMEGVEGAPWKGYKLVRGLGYLLLGRTDEALADFTGGGALEALGRGAAWTAAGDADRALKACLEALRLDPANKTALANKAWLEGKK